MASGSGSMVVVQPVIGYDSNDGGVATYKVGPSTGVPSLWAGNLTSSGLQYQGKMFE